MMRKIMLLSVIASLSAGTVTAKSSLQSVTAVENGVFTIGVADKIRRECGDISGRLLKARGELQSLYTYARQQGYSQAEIEAYVKADAEKKRMRAKRDAYLASKGVVKSRPETYCAAGRAEIETSSKIGALLRAR